jgi:hypothetical protein
VTESRTALKWAWYAGLIIIYAGALWVPFYNTVEPRFIGIPFFYWFQVGWIVVTAFVTALAHWARV